MATYKSSERTKQALIDAAGTLAAELGFGSVSVRLIANLAKENIGTIHYHFGGKEPLFEEVVNQVADRLQAVPLSEMVKALDLTDKTDQAKSVRIIIERMCDLLFDPEAPSWHRQVIFQIIQHPGPLQEHFHELVITPNTNEIIRILRCIDRQLTHEQAFVHAMIMQGPLVFHADYSSTILYELNKSDFDSNYISYLKSILIKQTQCLFDLPLI